VQFVIPLRDDQGSICQDVPGIAFPLERLSVKATRAFAANPAHDRTVPGASVRRFNRGGRRGENMALWQRRLGSPKTSADAQPP